MSQSEPAPERFSVFQASQEMMKQAFHAWEQLTNQYMEALLRNQQLLDVGGVTLENSLHMKQQIDRMVEATITNMQLPTRSDMDRALRKLNELEILLREVNEKLDQLLEKTA